MYIARKGRSNSQSYYTQKMYHCWLIYSYNSLKFEIGVHRLIISDRVDC